MNPQYVPITRFSAALRGWSAKSYEELPADKPPCGYLREGDDENRVLARVFARICELHTTTDRLAYLGTAIQVHERRLQMAFDAVRHPTATGPFDSEDRATAVRMRPYQAMINAMQAWLDELHEDATYTSPARRHSNQNHAHQPGEPA